MVVLSSQMTCVSRFREADFEQVIRAISQEESWILLG